VGLFIQDAWTINDRLTLNLGVRTENERVPSYTTGEGITETAIEFDFGQKLAPRLGFAYDVNGDGRWKAYGSWGIFYDIFKLELPRGSFGGDKWLEYYYSLDTPDWQSLDPAGCPPACPGTLIRGPIDFRHASNAPDANTIDPDLEPMRVQKLDFGVEHELTPRVALGVRYVHNQVDKAIEDVGALDAQGNEIYKIANPGFGTAAEFAVADSGDILPFPKAVRDYDSVEFSVDKRYADNWGIRVSYMWSRLHGNYSGLTQSDENGRTSPNVGRLFDYPLMAFNASGEPEFGPLGTDRPHQFKTQFTYTAPFGTSLGLNQVIESGVPVSREARMVAPNNFPVQYLGRGSDGRTDVFSQTDLQLQHDFRLAGDQRVTLLLNIINLFDQDAGINKFSTQTASGQGITVSEPEFYAGVDTEALIAAQDIPTDPRFLLDNDFQRPREIRFGVKFSF
jgi:outer membrane receptor protein involved in Fe transport